ncbi:hypothetical protein GIB67_007816 [Kingdonia uniflora]|uniref:protein-serine/threonine phosphatase n=1 Tax=Kingdonia uniflora TaxID=39325 RepID=A0A7J7N1Z2_9MAGN|nr:hypothetical protein GIB67_007816 [Kingdonia uniflora]
MAEICCESKSLSSSPSRVARRKRMEIRRFKFVSGMPLTPQENAKRQKKVLGPISPRECDNAVDNSSNNGVIEVSRLSLDLNLSSNEASLEKSSEVNTVVVVDRCPKFGMTSVCGRRRDMEDAVAIHPSFCKRDGQILSRMHFFGVYDGHGCSHVAMSCRSRLHELVKEEIETDEVSVDWRLAMARSFKRIDDEVLGSSDGVDANCRCELQAPKCDTVGSTAVVSVVTPDKIVVANCGDSRAVLCRGGRAVPLSIDHKPDRPDELQRVQAAGGRVIDWDIPRVLGVLAMSRAIGDGYLKPYVISEPEVTITGRTPEDDCMILASDGLWDKVSNETACGIVRMCLTGQGPVLSPSSPSENDDNAGDSSDKACSDAALLLTKLAMARNSGDNVSVVVVDLRRDS